jgi:uncharacterized membrane protein YkvA (DUF1232 family)/transcriptional regulator with XRE-family HTH domain
MFMRTSHLLSLIKETGLSPEKLAKRVNVSNMTVRRWMKRPPSAEIPKKYNRAFEDSVSGMIGDGVIGRHSRIARTIIENKDYSWFQNVIRNLGLSKNIYRPQKGSDTDRVIMGLSQIGADQARSSEVKDNIKKIQKHKGLGADWPGRIKLLLSVIFSKNIISLDKLVALGALYYLLYPFDLIPDYIPVIGMLDDYAILGLAAAYYMERFSDLSKNT